MTSTIDVPSTPRRERTAGHIVAIVVGVLTLLPALGILGGGVALAAGNAVVADDDGYFRYSLERVETDGVAVAATDLWLDEADGDTPWVFDWLDVDLRIRAEGAGTSDDVFIGIARTADLEPYLDGAAWSEVIEIDRRTAVTTDIAGRSSIEPPLDADFWTASTSGSGEQELVWRARGGQWSIVIMNADGTADVAADIELGARSGAVVPIAVTMIIVGAVGTLGSIALIVFGARGRRAQDPPHTGPVETEPPLTGAPLPPPTAMTDPTPTASPDREPALTP